MTQRVVFLWFIVTGAVSISGESMFPATARCLSPQDGGFMLRKFSRVCQDPVLSKRSSFLLRQDETIQDGINVLELIYSDKI